MCVEVAARRPREHAGDERAARCCQGEWWPTALAALNNSTPRMSHPKSTRGGGGEPASPKLTWLVLHRPHVAKVLAALAKHVARLETRLSAALPAAAAAAGDETDLWATIQKATTEGVLVHKLEAIEQLMLASLREANEAQLAAEAEQHAWQQRHAEAVQVRTARFHDCAGWRLCGG